MVTTPKQTAAEARSAAVQSEHASLYAVAGLTDALTEFCKGALVDTQERAGESLVRLQRRGADARQQARANADDLRGLVMTLPHQVMNLPEATRARIDNLQRRAYELKVQAGSTYEQLAGRGKRAVDEAIATARNLSDRTEDLAENVQADLAELADPVLERMQETVTQARKATTGRTATKTTISRSAARAAAARKAAASAAAHQVPAKRTAAKKAATARKATAKKASAE